jgi:hypothetical protein
MRRRASSCGMAPVAAAAVVAALRVSVTSCLESPGGLLTDLRPAPALGVSSTPTFTWVVPHVTTGDCVVAGAADPAAGQVQSAYQVQIFSGLTQQGVFDSGVVAGNSSVDVVPSLPAGVQLAAGGVYAWRVKTWVVSATTANLTVRPEMLAATCESDWSSNASFVVNLGPGGFSATVAQPIWTGSNSTRPSYAYFWNTFPLPAGRTATSDLVAAVAFVTGATDTDAKILGTYRLLAGGRTVSIGPGRGDSGVATPAFNMV